MTLRRLRLSRSLQQQRGIVHGVVERLCGLALIATQRAIRCCVMDAPGAGALLIVGPLKGSPEGGAEVFEASTVRRSSVINAS